MAKRATLEEWPGINPSKVRTDYLEKVFKVDSTRGLVERAGELLKQAYKDDPFQAIAVTGTSGLVMGGIVSYRFGIPLIVVRKPGTSDHHWSSMNVRGYQLPDQYVIFDDLISSGATVNRIYHAVKKDYPESKCVGVVLYLSSSKPYEQISIREEDGYRTIGKLKVYQQEGDNEA